MADNRVDIEIRANDKASSTFREAGSASESFGERMKKVAASLYVIKEAYHAVAGAVKAGISVAVDMVKAYDVQASAEKALIAAHNAMGEAGKEYIKSELAIAAAIQDETGVGDEVTIQRMARAKALGVETNKLGECAKGVVALTDVGMSEDAARRALAQAYNGNYSALQKYIPALKDVQDETEAQTILNEFLNQGYDRSKEKLDTTSGAWNALKGRIGDAKEVIGQAIVQNSSLNDVLKWCGDKVKDLSGQMADWCQNGGLAKAILFIKTFAENCKLSVSLALVELMKWYESGKYYLSVPFTYVADIAKNFGKLVGAEFGYLVDVVKTAIKKIKGEQAEWPTTEKIQETYHKLGDAVKGVNPKYTEMRENHAKTMQDLTATAEQMRKDSEQNLKKYADSYFQKMDEIREKNKETGTDIETVASKTKETVTQEAKESAEEVEKAMKAAEKAAKEREKAVKEAQAEWEKANNALKNSNKKTIRDAVKAAADMAKATKKQAKEYDRLAKQMNIYEDRLKHGGRLSKQQMAQLEEWRKLVGAEGAAAQKLAALKGGLLGAPGVVAGNVNVLPGHWDKPDVAKTQGSLANIERDIATCAKILNDCLRIG